jgi:DNA invertase Pin-like site-specific DNA recombinase
MYALKKRGAKPGGFIHVNHVKKGEANGSSVLLEQNVRKIRELAEQNVIYKDIAKQFGIHPSTVYRIIKRKIWSHV